MDSTAIVIHPSNLTIATINTGRISHSKHSFINKTLTAFALKDLFIKNVACL